MPVADEAPKLWLQFSNSNDFFLHPMNFLQKIGFSNILSIDMFVKYSFQKASWQTIIQGAEIETYNNDHNINDRFFAYSLTIPRETPITRSLLTAKLNQKKNISLGDFSTFIKSMPLFGLFLFAILFSLIPGKIWTILQGITRISIAIFTLYYGYKFIFYLINLTKSSSTRQDDHIINYINPKDLTLLTPKVRELLENLAKIGVSNVAIDRNTLYLKQELIKSGETNLIKELFAKKEHYSEKEKDKIMKDMIDMIGDPEFLALFLESND